MHAEKYKYILAGIAGLIFLIFLGLQLSKGIDTSLIEIKPQPVDSLGKKEQSIVGTPPLCFGSSGGLRFGCGGRTKVDKGTFSYFRH